MTTVHILIIHHPESTMYGREIRVFSTKSGMQKLISQLPQGTKFEEILYQEVE